NNKMIKKKLLIPIIGIILLIPIGLISRRISWIPTETGDALWAMMVFCLWRIVLQNKKLPLVAITSLAHCYLVEFSQMITWRWLVSFRQTFIGHMMLGQGFLWIDLLAYSIGIIVIYMIFSKIEEQ
ncbi:MAG: DUF2809 domain-containing protein, partial [Bacteroidaceae bacterium]|nr:DUF2809 domain-containing protein [Bacteroidaceae bacterium]